MKSIFPKPQLRFGVFGFLAATVLSAVPALASGAGPGGVNVGFDFNWNNGPNGYTASFIRAVSGSGAMLNNCGLAVRPTTSACDFVFAYRIGGVAQTPVAPGG